LSMSTKMREVCCLATKKRRKEGSIMKKMIFVLVMLLMVSPVLADVNITASADVNGNSAVVTISYATTDSEAIRAVALDITLVGDACVVDVNCVNGDFTIYPGSINIAGDGSVSDYGSCLCDSSYAGTLAGLESNGVTLEMGSLYVGAPNAPADSGVLAELTIEGCDSVDVAIALNSIRGGVVLENPDDLVTVNATGTTAALDSCFIPECMKTTAPQYADWVAWGKPDCWCYAKQCKGDINGTPYFGKDVTLSDLNLFKLAFNKSTPDLELVANGICADLNQAAYFGKRVTLSDLNTFKLYFNQSVVPECDDTNYNFWLVP